MTTLYEAVRHVVSEGDVSNTFILNHPECSFVNTELTKDAFSARIKEAFELIGLMVYDAT